MLDSHVWHAQGPLASNTVQEDFSCKSERIYQSFA